MKRTFDEIEIMKSKLLAEKENLPEFSSFGDNNWWVTDRMIDVLDGKITTINEIYDLADKDDSFDESLVISALYWLNGDVDDSELIDDW